MLSTRSPLLPLAKLRLFFAADQRHEGRRTQQAHSAIRVSQAALDDRNGHGWWKVERSVALVSLARESTIIIAEASGIANQIHLCAVSCKMAVTQVRQQFGATRHCNFSFEQIRGRQQPPVSAVAAAQASEETRQIRRAIQSTKASKGLSFQRRRSQ